MSKTQLFPVSIVKSRLSFKARQHCQEQLYLQYKACWVMYKIVGAPSLCVQPPLQFWPKIRSSTLVNFYLPIAIWLGLKIILTIPTNTPFVYTSAILHLFCVQPSQQSLPKIFSLSQPFSKFKLHQGTRELESFVRNGTVLISPFFPKLWAVITGVSITDSLWPRLIKLVYCR